MNGIYPLVKSLSYRYQLKLLNFLLPLLSPEDVQNSLINANTKSTVQFSSFPDEIILLILAQINDISSLAKVARCNHHLALLVRDNHLWKTLYHKHLASCTGFGSFPISQPPKRLSNQSSRVSLIHSSCSSDEHIISPDDNSTSLMMMDNIPSNNKCDHYPSSFFSFKISPFCLLFRNNYLTALNWRKGNFRVSKITRLIGSIHTDFDLANTLAVSLSINGPSLWNYASGSQPIQLLDGNENVPFTTIKLTDQYIISASRDTIVRVWDKHSYQLICSLSGIHEQEVGVLVCDQDWIVSGSEDSSLQVWQLPQGHPIETFRGLHTEAITAIAVDRTHCRIVSASADGSVWIHQKQKDLMGKSRSFQLNRTTTSTDPASPIFAIGMSNKFIITGDANGNIEIYQLDPNNLSVPIHRLTKMRAHAGPVICIQLDGHKWVSGSGDCTIKVWTLYEDQETPSGPLYTISHSALTGPIHTLKYNDNVLVCSDITSSTVIEYDFSHPVVDLGMDLDEQTQFDGFHDTVD